MIEISDLENELHVSLNGNTLVRGKGEKLVIIHDGVHGFNPVSVQISIKDNPLGVSVSLFGVFSEFAREETINPFTSLDMDNSIELVGVDDLGVDWDNGGLLAVKLVGLGKGLPGLRFSTAGGSHGEDTMANSQELTKLHNLKDVSFIREHLEFSGSCIDLAFELHISHSNGVNSGEKISKEATENF